MPRTHIAIITHDMAAALKSGRKRVETRFSRTRRPPFGRVAPGDVIYFKVSGGSIIGTCRVRAVREFGDLDPARIHRLRRRYGRAVSAPAAYWRRCRLCRYAVLIWLGPLGAVAGAPAVPRQFGSAWLIVAGPAARTPGNPLGSRA